MGQEQKMVMAERVRGMGFWRAYRVLRRAGEAPWCSLRIALLYGR